MEFVELDRITEQNNWRSVGNAIIKFYNDFGVEIGERGGYDGAANIQKKVQCHMFLMNHRKQQLPIVAVTT